MGVLESVDLKQKNYPFRKKFEEFYEEYELLSSRYSEIRYYQMTPDIKANENFKGHVQEIFRKCVGDIGGEGEKYAIGRSKVLMMPTIKTILDKCMAKAAASRNMNAKVIKNAFMVFQGAL